MSTIIFQSVNTALKSVDNGAPVTFSITNNSNSAMEIYWVDRDGVRKDYGTIQIGQTYTQSTLTSHYWEVKSADGKTALDFLPTIAGNIKFTSTGTTPVFTDFSEKVTSTTDGLWSSHQGYGLVDVAKSLGVAHATSLPVNGQNNNLALNAINAADAWAAGYTGKGVKVAVIDAGIAANSEINKAIIGGYDFYDNDTDPTPDAGTFKDHALGVASIIAASHAAHGGQDTMGVAPDVQLLNVRVGSSTYGSSPEAMVKGINWAVDNGAKVICMPLQNSALSNDSALATAIHNAYQHNVVVVVIGGNYSNYGPTGPAMIAQQLKGELIDVGNYNVMAGTPFDSSNMPGDTPFPWVMASSSGYVPNSTGGYSYWADGGTSFAGPYVAGLAALLWQQNPSATAAQIIGLIQKGASLGGTAANTTTSNTVPSVGTPVINTPIVTTVTQTVTMVKGTDAIDTRVFAHASTDYKLATDSTGTTITEIATGNQTVLNGVERLQFTDKSVALDITGNAGEVYRLYQAAFNRTPDKAGLGYWIDAMDHGMSLADVAAGFVGSAEFKTLYGTAPGNPALVHAMYNNVLHRHADEAGLNYWVGAMDRGLTTTQLLTAFSDSAENITAVGKIIGQGFDYTPFHA